MRSILIMLVMIGKLFASSDIVVKLGADTKKYNANLIKLEKELKIIGVELNNLDNTIAIPSHAAGEVNNLEMVLNRATEVSKITELVPSLKEKGQEFRNNIQEVMPSVQKAREVSNEVSVEVVSFHKKIKETKKNVQEIYAKVTSLIKKDVPSFQNDMTEAQDCVYKSDQTKRECMQDKLNSAADDLKDVIEDSNKEVITLGKSVVKLKGKIAHLQRVIQKIHSLITPIQKLEYKVNKLILPYLDLYELMHKNYETKFLMPDPYKPKKNNWFYLKVTGKDIIIGVLHTMDEIEKKLKGDLLNQANKASVKKLATALTKQLDKDLKNVLKKLETNIDFKIKGLATLHKIDSTLMDPLEDLVSAMKDIKLEVSSLKAAECGVMTKKCD